MFQKRTSSGIGSGIASGIGSGIGGGIGGGLKKPTLLKQSTNSSGQSAGITGSKINNS